MFGFYYVKALVNGGTKGVVSASNQKKEMLIQQRKKEAEEYKLMKEYNARTNTKD